MVITTNNSHFVLQKLEHTPRVNLKLLSDPGIATMEEQEEGSVDSLAQDKGSGTMTYLSIDLGTFPSSLGG